MKEQALSQEYLQKTADQAKNDGKLSLLRHALSRTPLTAVIYRNESRLSPEHSLEVKTMSVCDQKASGRCWIFAGLNLLREIIAKKLDAANFELSQNYLALFDKVEKSNFALCSILSLLEEGKEPNERVFMHVLTEPVGDGGQWDMFVNLVTKYGLLPKAAFPETYQSSNTRESDFLVNEAIRGFAAQAHKLFKSNRKQEAYRLKEETIDKIYKLFLSCFGVPPESFDLVYVDKKGEYHREADLTPSSFFEKYIGAEFLCTFQSLINSPTEDKPFFRNFTVDYLGNVIEGRPINHLNVPMDRMEEAIIAQLKDGLPVWFGSDVSFNRDRELPYWSDQSHDYQGAFGLDIAFDKADMLDFRGSAMNHAMLITGVDLKDDKPVSWKIENSWGDKNGDKGYYYMSESWFSHFVYQAVVSSHYLNEAEKKAAAAEPTHLPPWDPMGTLA